MRFFKLHFARKIFCCLVILSLILASVAGCSESTPDAMDLIPDNAGLIGSIKVKEIISDKDMINTYNDTEKGPGQPETFDDAMDQLLEETGLDLRDFTEITMFADTSLFSGEQYLAFIAEGNFDEEEFIDNIEETSEFELDTREYKDYKLYLSDDDDFCIVFISSKMLVLGTTEAVEDAIDVSKGDREKLSGVIIDTYDQMGDTLARLVLELPETARQALREEQTPGDFPLSTDSFSDIDIIGISIDQEGDTAKILINMHFKSTDSAQAFQNTLNGFILLMNGTSVDPNINKVFDNISITASGLSVNISLEITASQIEEISKAFQQQMEF